MRNTRDRSITHKLAKMSFDQIFHLTAGVYQVFLYYTSGTPEICQLPAGMADKNKLVLYPLY